MTETEHKERQVVACTSFEHFPTAVASLSIGRVRPGIVCIRE
jgi:hypothetical protein